MADLAPDRGDGRKVHYGSGEQPWDVIVASGWGPAFAAGNVVKYLRRNKAPEHSLESARWYYARLYEGAAGDVPNWTNPEAIKIWEGAIGRLEMVLTNEEIILLRGSA